jgi:hypothetical protein
MVAGGHFYVWSGISQTIFSIYNSCILGNITNNEHSESWEVLRRMGLDLITRLEKRLRCPGFKNQDNDADKYCMFPTPFCWSFTVANHR